MFHPVGTTFALAIGTRASLPLAIPGDRAGMEAHMSGLGDKVKGAVNEVKGNAKQEYGRQTGDAEVAAEGERDEVKGKAQGVVGTVKNATDDIKDTVKR